MVLLAGLTGLGAGCTQKADLSLIMEPEPELLAEAGLDGRVAEQMRLKDQISKLLELSSSLMVEMEASDAKAGIVKTDLVKSELADKINEARLSAVELEQASGPDWAKVKSQGQLALNALAETYLDSLVKFNQNVGEAKKIQPVDQEVRIMGKNALAARLKQIKENLAGLLVRVEPRTNGMNPEVLEEWDRAKEKLAEQLFLSYKKINELSLKSGSWERLYVAAKDQLAELSRLYVSAQAKHDIERASLTIK